MLFYFWISISLMNFKSFCCIPFLWLCQCSILFYSIIQNRVSLSYLLKLHKGCTSSSSAWVLWHIEPGPDCLTGNPLMFAASASIDPHRRTCAMGEKMCVNPLYSRIRCEKDDQNQQSKEFSSCQFLKLNVPTHRFKCTRTMGGSFQISSFLVESLWALQCLQNTLLLSVNFSSFEKSLRQSWQRETTIQSFNPFAIFDSFSRCSLNPPAASTCWWRPGATTGTWMFRRSATCGGRSCTALWTWTGPGTEPRWWTHSAACVCSRPRQPLSDHPGGRCLPPCIVSCCLPVNVRRQKKFIGKKLSCPTWHTGTNAALRLLAVSNRRN